MLKNLALLLTSFAFALAALEIAIRARAVPIPDHVHFSDGWWKERWQRFDRYMNPREFVDIDPELGWVPAPDLEDVPYQGARISTNAAGMRGPREVEPVKERPRVVAIGDSYTFGQCVGDEETFPARLQQRLPGAEVLNLGVMGYAHGQMLMRLRRDGLPHDPDVVLLGFHPMDIRRSGLCFRDYAKPCFRLVDGELAPPANLPIEPPAAYADDLRLLNYGRMLVEHLAYERRKETAKDLTRSLVRTMARESREAGARFAMVYLPRPRDLEREEPIGSYLAAALCEQSDFPCISPKERIRKALDGRDPEPHFECHYSAEVQAHIGAEVAEALGALWPERVGLETPPTPRG